VQAAPIPADLFFVAGGEGDVTTMANRRRIG
jgi:hypothetical protein